MSFYEIQFPDNISYGSSGGPGFSTTIVGLDTGAEQRVSRWSKSRRKYDVSYGIKTYADLQSVLEFYMCVKGAAYGFRYKDWLDFTTANDGRSTCSYDDVPLKTYQAGGLTGANFTAQLKKRYQQSQIAGGDTTVVTRNIFKPVLNTVRVGKQEDGETSVTEMVSGWSVSIQTGVITFDDYPDDGTTIYAGCEFDVPVRFTKGMDDLLSISLDTFEYGTTSAIDLVEILDHGEHYDEYFYGGADTISFDADISIAVTQGRVIALDPTDSGLSVTLPDPWAMPSGGPCFYLANISGTSVQLTDARDPGDHTGASSQLDYALSGNTTITMWVVEYLGGSKEWFVWESSLPQ
jgi:uncharacterized protein (TIGR02217 family)